MIRSNFFFHAVSYVWRLVGTALSFALFGLGGLILGCVIIPVRAVFIRDAERRITGTRQLFGSAMRFFISFMASMGVLRFQIEGMEHVREDENYLILANHPSLIDVVFLIACFPQAVCVVKQALFDNPFTRRAVRLAGYLSNHDPAEMLAGAEQRLKKGRSLILFPEGTRTTPGAPLRFQQAAAAIAVRADQLCLPILIDVRPTTLTKADRWFHVPAEPVCFRMIVQRPLRPFENLGHNPDKRRPDRDFNRFLLAYFEERLAA